ncbi:3540_t:CDS:2 [Funneliformis caledonium]|uniref:3540_t:CDS:1 n=1 Tax=Funneliformis caledonium TaxID=1117310 RepID=A0A9N8V9Z6_9GLOM|nr:3540_t:CDS:2 [Funneliformis caledonium]
MVRLPRLKYKNNDSTQGSSGILTYVYRWKITNWSEIRPFMENTSPPFSADGLQWVFKFYKGRQKNPQALSLYLGILETTPGCLLGIRKKVSIIFVLENLRTRGMDFGKMELPVWFCNNSPPKISNPFDKLVNSPRFSDVTFCVLDDNSREKLFYAHKGILASSSPVFESMLTNGKEKDTIKLCQTNHSAFLALLTFIYTFNVNITSLCDAEDLLALADKFEIFPVREECLQKYPCAKTSTTCRDFVASNFEDLLEDPSTLHADPNILRLALDNDEANVNSEEKIYELVVRWANYSYSSDSDTSSARNSTNTRVNDEDSPPSSSTSASMPSELPENFEDAVDDIQFIENGIVNIKNLYELNNEQSDIQNDGSNKFPKPWCGDRFAALPSLLKCVRFPVMKKQYIFEKVEGNPFIMAADGMKDLVIEAYRHLLMLEVPNSGSSSRVKHRKRKKTID